MADSNIYLATTNNEQYLINPIDWTDKTGNGVKDNSIPGSKIKDASIPSSKIVGGVASEDTYAREQLLLKQNINDTTLKTTNKTIVGAINEIYDNGGGGSGTIDTVARERTQNITAAEGNTSFKGNIFSNSILTSSITTGEIRSEGNIPISLNALSTTADINNNGHVSLSNRYYEPLTTDNNYRNNTNGALGWYVWRHAYIDENDKEISINDNITITNVKLKYATGLVLESFDISIKLSDWLYFKNAFNNRSIVTKAVKKVSDNRSNYVVTYFQLSPQLDVTKVNNLYQITYGGELYNVTQTANYKYIAKKVGNESVFFNCIAQTKNITELTNNDLAKFALILLNTETDDGTYSVSFSLPTDKDNYEKGTTNIHSNEGKSLSDESFNPTLNWNVYPTVTNITKCRLYLSNKQATITEFESNSLPKENLGNLFTNLSSLSSEELSTLTFSYTQNVHYTDNLKYVSHDYTQLETDKYYNVITLSYQNPGYGDTSTANIYYLFENDYGDEAGNIRSWDTSLRVTQRPDLGATQIFSFSYAEGFGTIAAGGAAHAEGKGCKTYEDFSHVEGSNNINVGYGGHSEGWNNINYGYAGHVEGYGNICKANYSHVEGHSNIVNAESSHAEGYQTIASSRFQHVGGKWNIEDSAGKYAFIIGNGTTESNRSNALTLDWNGNLEVAGKGSFYTSTTITNPDYGDQLIITDNKITVANGAAGEGFKIQQVNSSPFEFITYGRSFTFKPSYTEGSNRYLSINPTSSDAYGITLDSYSLELQSEEHVKLYTGQHNEISLDNQNLKISTQGSCPIIIDKDGFAIAGSIKVQFQVSSDNQVTPIFTYVGV